MAPTTTRKVSRFRHKLAHKIQMETTSNQDKKFPDFDEFSLVMNDLNSPPSQHFNSTLPIPSESGNEIDEVVERLPKMPPMSDKMVNRQLHPVNSHGIPIQPRPSPTAQSPRSQSSSNPSLGAAGLVGAVSLGHSESERFPQRFQRGLTPGFQNGSTRALHSNDFNNFVNGSTGNQQYGANNQVMHQHSQNSVARNPQPQQHHQHRKESDAMSNHSNESGVSGVSVPLNFVPHENLESYRQEIKNSKDPIKHFEFGKQLILVAEGTLF